MNKSESWRQRGNKGEKNREDKDFALTPRPWKGGSSVSPLAPSSKIGYFRKYCYSAGASIGVTYCPLSPLMNGIRSLPNSNHYKFCVSLYVYILYTDVNIQHMLVTETFAIYNLLLLCAFLWCRLPPAIRGHIPGLAISDVGAKAGSEGLKCSDCSPCTTRLFSAARHFQTVPHFSELIPLKGCICICQYVHRGTDVILDRACVRM